MWVPLRCVPFVVLLSACAPQTGSEDADGDGSPRGVDCDDGDAGVSPGAIEVPYDDADNDCDPSTKDDDLDGDGFPLLTDCDDTDPAVSTSVVELPYDGVDNDCNADTPDDDVDGDGHGLAEDCDDGDATVSPSASELPYDGVDNDCNTETPDDDLDDDGYDANLDCDDADADVYPGSDVRCVGLADADLKLMGESGDDAAGHALALGDLDGDGTTDLVVGAPDNDAGGAGAGKVYVVSGSTRGIVSLADADYTFALEEGAALGSALAVADLNGDGQDDLVIGAPGPDGASQGAVYFLPGPLTSDTAMVSVARMGRDDANQGEILAAGGDVAGDGLPDLVVGGELDSPYAHLVPGNADADFDTCGPRFFVGEQISAAALADVTGDGLADVVLSNTQHDSDGAPAQGGVHVYTDVAAEECSEYNEGEVLIEGDTTDQLGESVAAGADVNGDGYGDLLATAPQASSGPAIYIFPGPLSAGARPVATAALTTNVDLSEAGTSAAMEDLDGDGRADVAIGDRQSVAGTGGAWIAFGPLEGNILLESEAAFVGGEAEADSAGSSVATHAAGLLAVGAPAHAGTGAAYLFFGNDE